jgi:hypothetical protein
MEHQTSKFFEARTSRMLHLMTDFEELESESRDIILQRVELFLQLISVEEWKYVILHRTLFIERKYSSRIFVNLTAIYLACGNHYIKEEKWSDATKWLKIGRNVLAPAVLSIISGRSPTNEVGESVLAQQIRILSLLLVSTRQQKRKVDRTMFSAELQAITSWKPSFARKIMHFVKTKIGV